MLKDIQARNPASLPARNSTGDAGANVARGQASARAGGRARQSSLKRFGLLLFALFSAVVHQGQAAIQFDVFLGYDGFLGEANWFPVVCEIKNDGPSFNGIVEVDHSRVSQGQKYQLLVELPTGTLKRVVIPVFSATRGFTSWDVRLLDDRGKTRAEQPDVRPRRQVLAETPIIGALARTSGGVPQIHPVLAQQAELQPAAARLLPAIFPDNPLALDGLDALYLNSERASDLTVPQVQALTSWLHAGGHLIVAVEQPSDVSASPWLRTLFPVEVRELRTLNRHSGLGDWIRKPEWPARSSLPEPSNRSGSPSGEADRPFATLADDFGFEASALQVAVGQLRSGRVLAQEAEVPLMVTETLGQGRVTALLFSPEREPVRSWKLLPQFWARLAEVPGDRYVSSEQNQYSYGGWSSDGIFGAMLDTRQVHKLPIAWLLLLLVVYLVVIGPLDHYWLKRIGRPMLTWITFPCYVVFFSLLIYFIGYKLRAGDSEWNQMHVVDVLGEGARAELRGRTYASVYAPANQTYALEGRQRFSTIRGESAASWSGHSGQARMGIVQNGGNYQADVFVPVWTSQLLVSDWLQPASYPPLQVTVANAGGELQIKVENRTESPVSSLHFAFGDRLVPLGEIAAKQTRTFTVPPAGGMMLKDYVWQHGAGFQNAVQSRQQAFGQSARSRIDDLPNGAIAASFLGHLPHQEQQYNRFIIASGTDLSPVLANGGGILLGWSANQSPTAPMHRFSPKRFSQNTLWRVAVTLPQP